MNLFLQNLKVQLRPRRYKRDLAEAERMLRSLTEPENGVAERLRSLLRSDWWEVRNCALKIIARIRCKDLYGQFVGRLLDRGEAGILRRNCAELIPAVGLRSPDIIDALRRALSDPYWEVRSEAAHALAQLAGESAELEHELLALLGRERNLEVRASVAQALGAVATSRAAVDALAEIAADDKWLVRHQAAVALIEMGGRRPEFAGEAADVIGRLDLLAEGAATTSVFRQHVLELAELTARGRPYPTTDAMKRRYMHLKHGWLRKKDGRE